MQSLMLDHFSAYGLLCRLGGCFFIQNLRRQPFGNARVAWKSFYTLYSASCFIFSFGCLFWFEAVTTYTDSRTSGQSDRFSNMLVQTQHAIVRVKVFLNFLSMITGSGRLLDFFRKSAMFEWSSAFVSSKAYLRNGGGRLWSLLRRTLVIVTLAATYVMFMHFYVAQVANAMAVEWALPYKVIGSIAGLFIFLYESLCYVVLRCCSGVLLEYIRAQLTALEVCSESSAARAGSSQASRQLETIRLNLCSIRELTRGLNNMWEISLAGTGIGIVLMNCVVFYWVFHDGIFKREVWVTLSYCTYSSFAFMELVYVSQALMDETQKLKNAVKAIRTPDPTGGYAEELRYLHESIDPKGMCFNGGGFFQLSKSLLVSMTGSIITFTVILVQTSDELSSKMDTVYSTP
ncbi:unnamed protein product [Ixodes hexagonus]